MSESVKPDEIATELTRLAVPFDDNKRVIRAAGKLKNGENALHFEKESKVWYAKPGANLTRLKEWVYDPSVQVPTTVAENPQDEFASFLEQRGVILDGEPIMDGKKHYVDIEGHQRGSKKGVYAGFMDGRPAGWFRNYAGDQELERWTSSGQKVDPAVLAQMRADSAAKKEVRDRETAIGFDKRAGELMAEFNALPAASGQEQYLVSKGVGADGGLKTDRHGNVVIPLYNVDGEFRSLERIWPDGNKVLATGGQAWGAFYVVGGQLRDGNDIHYAEGYSTAKSINEATGQPVVMTVNAGNMVEVAGKLNEAYPNSRHFFMADNDIYKTHNAGLDSANDAAAITGGHVITPAFTNPRKGLTDFNDLHAEEGLSAVRTQISDAIAQLNQVNNMPNEYDPAVNVQNTVGRPSENTEQQSVPAAPEPAADTPAAPEPAAAADAPAAPEPTAATDTVPQAAISSAESDPEVTEAVQPAVTAKVDGNEYSAAEGVSDLPPLEDYAEEYGQFTADSEDDYADYTPQAASASALTPVAVATAAAVATPAEAESTSAETVAGQGENPETEKKKAKKEQEAATAQQNGITWAADDNVSTPPKERLDLDALMQRITYREEKDHVAYMLEGKDAFYDYGNQLRMANESASKDDAMILAALQTAMAQHKRGIEITGSDEFKENVLALMAEYKVDARLSDPTQRARFQELQKTQAAATTANTTTTSESKTQAETSKTQQGKQAKEDSAISQNGLNVSADTSPLRVKSDAEENSGWVSGVVLAHGSDHYAHDKKNAMSYFVKLQNERGEKEVWGKDLERAMHDAGVDKGRLVNLRTVGEKDVEVSVPVRDENDKVLRFEKINTKRMEWEVKAAYPQKSQANPQALKPSDLVPYDAVTFNQVRDMIQQMKIDLSHERLPKNDMYWFQPNGKPAPAEMEKPAQFKLGENSKNMGTALLASPAGKGSNPEYILFESKAGFMQGVVRDHESGKYHSVIGKVNTKYKDGERKDYITLAAVNANSANGMVWHGYGNAMQNGKGIVYQNVMNKENQTQHLQPVSDDVKNKSVMKQILSAGNAAKQSDDERGTQHHAPSTKSAPKP